VPVGVFDHPPDPALHLKSKEIGHGYAAEFGRFLTSDAYRFLRWSKLLDL